MVIRKVRVALRRLISSKEGLGSLSFFVATGVASISNFIFHAAVSRILGPATYGALGSLLNVILLLTVPLSAIQVSVTRAAASWTRGSEVHSELRRLLVISAIGALVGAIIMVGIAPVLSGYLHLHSPATIDIIAAWLVPAVIGTVLQGALMGERRFLSVAVANVVGTVIGRMAIGITLVAMGLGLTGAIMASLIGQVVVTVLVYAPYARYVFKPHTPKGKGIGSGETTLSLLSLTGYWMLASMDVVFARHFLSPRRAGLYASAATTGRIALFLPGAIASLALPRLAIGSGKSEEAREALRWSLSVVTTLGLFSAVVLAIIPRLVVTVLFGPQFAAAATTLRILGFEGAALGILGLLTYYELAKGSYYSLSSFLGVAIALILITLFHSSRTEIAVWMLLGVSLSGVVMFVSAMNGLLRDP